MRVPFTRLIFCKGLHVLLKKYCTFDVFSSFEDVQIQICILPVTKPIIFLSILLVNDTFFYLSIVFFVIIIGFSFFAKSGSMHYMQTFESIFTARSYFLLRKSRC